MTKALVALSLTIGMAACDGNDDDDTNDTDTDDTDTEDTDDTDVPCPENGTSGERITCIVNLDGDTAAGETFYDFNCQACHCDDGSGGCGPSDPPAADLTASPLHEQDVVAILLLGSEGTDMDSYASHPNQDLANVTEYVMETFITP